MTPHNGFNLIDEPWIIVVDDDGREDEVSILELFGHAHRFVTIGGEVPTQVFAITRLLLAFLHRAIDGPADQAQWEELWTTDQLPMDLIHSYAEQVRLRFDLFDPVAPFYQVADLCSVSGDVTHLRKVVADVPDPGTENLPLFTTRSIRNLVSMDAAEAARWLIHTHAYDPAGTKTPVVGGGSRYGSSLGWAGQIGGILPVGRNLRETLLLNLIARDTNYVRVGGADDRPPWEREPDGPDWHDRPPRGAIDLYTWQTRRLRLVREHDRVTALVLAKGDTIDSRDKHNLEPHTPWRLDTAQKDKKVHYRPKRHDPKQSVWRGISALLPSKSPRPSGSGGGQPQESLAPGVLQWISDLAVEGYLPEDYRPALRAFGTSYRASRTAYEDIIDDDLPLSILLLREDRPEAGRAAANAVTDDADDAATAVRRLAENVARAAGARQKPGEPKGPITAAGESARELLYANLEEPYRRWLMALAPDSDIGAARAGWQTTVADTAKEVAGEVISAAAPSAWTGREIQIKSGKKEHMDLALADSKFRRSLGRMLPLAQLGTPGIAPQEVH
jgi:CRISPR system Cascade subunit CasA